MSEPNGRTHEPSLRELTAELDGVRELLLAKVESSRTVMDERDVRYEQRFKAMDEKTSLGSLKESRSEGSGEKSQNRENRRATEWLIGLIFLILAFVIGHFWR